jgi:nicotinamide-nucleotide amidase
MLAEIIAVGSEMLTPHRQDTNSLYLTAGLNDLGVSVAFKTIVGDNRKHLVSAIRIALSRADIVLLSGGLGPTEDDLTRECLAEVLHLKLHRSDAILESLRQRFSARNIAMSPNNAKQADVLDGATILPNAAGSAPGQWLDIHYEGNRKLVALLPGPPKELKPLFDAECKPRLAAALPGNHLARRILRMALIPESQVDERTAPIYQQFPDVETTILAGHAEIQLHFVCVKPTLAEAEARVDDVLDLVAREMGDAIFSFNGESLEEIVLLMLGVRGHTLSIAESCTGGWLGERLTAIPNSSRVFLGGAIAYSDRSKTALADAPPTCLQSMAQSAIRWRAR